jgi:hypothetical protein
LSEVHTYRWPWQRVGLGTLAVAVVAVVAVRWLGYAPAVGVGTVLVMAAWFRWGNRLDLADDEVSWGFRRARWDELELRVQAGRVMLATTGGLSLRGRIKARLHLYDPEWATGPIGDDLRRWAPDLARRIPPAP